MQLFALRGERALKSELARAEQAQKHKLKFPQGFPVLPLEVAQTHYWTQNPDWGPQIFLLMQLAKKIMRQQETAERCGSWEYLVQRILSKKI